MKRFLLSAALLFAGIFIASAQTYKPVKVDVGLGYAIPTNGGEGVNGGITFTVEPHYRLSDEIAVGLRFEGAALARVNDTGDEDSDAEVSILSSYSVTGDYYLGSSGFRPFVGAGMGFFRSASITLDSESVNELNGTIPGETNFGLFPRVGFETGHFRMSGEYNIVKDSGYLAFKIGFFLGGGRRN